MKSIVILTMSLMASIFSISAFALDDENYDTNTYDTNTKADHYVESSINASNDNGINSFGASLVRCESWDFAPEICFVDVPLNSVQLVQQHSSSSCSGSWLDFGTGIYVDSGCRATFLVTSSSPKTVYSKTCSSNDYKYSSCSIPSAGAVWVSRKLSNSECKSDQSWGYDANTSRIWVDDGCRAIFNYVTN